ncbi:MAG: alpha-amylase/4-alpha-glucanotransferase domain-containing protein [Spirochaetales bacterium]
MNPVSLIFGTTNTLPVGTPNYVFEQVYQRSFKSFLRVLYNTPTFPLTLHFSGTMLSWLDSEHSEFTDVIGEMVQRRQVELIGGAFYDPVFSLIPAKDRLGQVESLTTLIRKRFGRRPRGAWVTEHVWEPSVASTLRNSGIEYVFLDDYNLIAGGVPSHELSLPCITEDQGKTLLVFPVQARLQARVGACDPAELIDDLARIGVERAGAVVSIMFDGTRYGAVGKGAGYDDRWIERFVKLVQENSDWLSPTTPWRYSRRSRERKRYYFPATSYEEMTLWSLHPERQQDLLSLKERINADAPRERSVFLSGGFFRQFLTRYIESNLLYAKMQYTCLLVNQIRGDKYRKQAARHELWKGQCHDAYWHGKPGGIYRNYLRKAAYSSLIEAEKVTREKGIFIPSIVRVDFDMDGIDEYLYQGQEINAYVHRRSGAMFELDYLARPWNYLDTMTRVRERYHDDLDARVEVDGYWRKAFIDHLFAPESSIDEFDSGRIYGENIDPNCFCNMLYDVAEYDRDEGVLVLTASSAVDETTLSLRKEYRFERNKVTVRTRIGNSGSHPVRRLYGCEVNLSFASDEVDALRLHVRPEADAASARKNLARKPPSGYEKPNGTVSEVDPEKHTFNNVGTVVFEDLKNQIDLSLSVFEPTECWSLPVRTVSAGECGEPEVTYQSSCLVPLWQLSLDPGEERELYLQLRMDGE